MNRILRIFTAVFIFSVFTVSSSFSQEDFTKYIDPTIENVSRFLAPTYPTFHLPNQMIRMFPVKQDCNCVFTSIGLYRVTPGLPFYIITSPVFDETTINLTNGYKILQIDLQKQ